MKYRLGIDLGTASIGAAALELDESGNLIGSPWHAIRIFSEPLESGKAGLKPKKAGRREARTQRRQIERRARRVRRVAYLARLLGLDHKKIPPHPGPGFSTLRARAARQRIELEELMQVFLRITKNRGYKGEFRATDDPDLGAVKSGSHLLTQELQELAAKYGVSTITLGEYLEYRTSELGLPVRLKIERDNISDLFALRKMVEDEYDQIWAVQEQFHPILKNTYKSEPVKKYFKDAIFYQRPLKSPQAMVGKCPLEINLPRAPRAQIAAQNFRIEKTLGDMRWGMGRRCTHLSEDQRKAIRSILYNPEKLRADGTITFKALYKELEAAGCPRPDTRSLNLERSSRDELKGNTTLVSFKKLGVLDKWLALEPVTQIQIINFLADLGSPEQLDTDTWHKRILKANFKQGDSNPYRTLPASMVTFVNILRKHEKFDRFTKMGFEGGRSAYSIKALENLANWMQVSTCDIDSVEQPRVDEDAAIQAVYPGRFTKPETSGRLDHHRPTGNDVVDGALRELKRVVNSCIDALGTTPTEVIIETARELGSGAETRNQWEKRSQNNNKKRKIAAKEISDAGEVPTATKLLRYQLWKEQEEHCPYCATIIGFHEALKGSETHIEHILPRSLTRIGRKRSELVIAHRSCNLTKGDRTPYQAFNDTDRWPQIEGHAKRFEELGKANYRHDRPLSMAYFRKAKLLLIQDYANDVLNDESIAGFADRQLHQTSWIAKATIEWLSSICSNVFASRGEMTAGLRSCWKLDTVIPQVRYGEGYPVIDIEGKLITESDFNRFRPQWEGHVPKDSKDMTDRRINKRIDHRHHIIDALTIAATSRGVYQRMARKYIEETEAVQKGIKKRRDWSIEPPVRNIREIALEIVGNCNLTHKPDRNTNGPFFEETAYGVTVREETGDSVLTLRRTIADLANAKDRIEDVRKSIQTIASDATRKVVSDNFETRISRGESPKDALLKPIHFPGYHTPIQKVRCLKVQGMGFRSSEGATIIEHSGRSGVHQKRLIDNGIACLDIRSEAGKPIIDVVSLAKFRASPKTPSGVMRIFKNDTVRIKTSGIKLLVRQFNAAAGGCLFATPLFETRLVDQLSASDGRKKISGRNLLNLEVMD